jgi:hypothetical protein
VEKDWKGIVKISQREACRLRKRVRELEAIQEGQRRQWRTEWPSGTVLERITPEAKTVAIVDTARRLGHPVVVVPDGNQIVFFGIGKL